MQQEAQVLAIAFLLAYTNMSDNFALNERDHLSSDSSGPSSGPSCQICLEPLLVAERLSQFSNCGHQFHKSCIQKWKKQSCPTCRAPEARASDVLQNTQPRTEWPKYAPGSICKLVGLEKRPDLNGAHVVVRRFDFHYTGLNERYIVDITTADFSGCNACENNNGIEGSIGASASRNDASQSAGGPLKIKEANLEFVRRARFDIEDIRKMIRRCSPHAVCTLPPGCFRQRVSDSTSAADDTLIIDKPLSLVGRGQSRDGSGTVLQFPVEFDSAETGKLTLESLRIEAPVRLKGRRLEQVNLTKVTIDCSGCAAELSRRDALHLHGCTADRPSKNSKKASRRMQDRVILERCSILGGSDGINVDCPDCIIRSSEILNAQSRGLIISESCTVKDVTVQGCGGYGVKTRGSLLRRGRNNIQEGPWDNQPWNMNFEEDSDLEGWLGVDLGGRRRSGSELFGGDMVGQGMFGDDMLDDFNDDYTECVFLRPDGSSECKTMDWLETNGLDDELCLGVYGDRAAWNNLTEHQRQEFRSGGIPV